MNFRVLPADFLRGSVDLPASKSYSIRSFIVAACGGESKLLGPSDCEDARAAMRVARLFGARIRPVSGGFLVSAAPRCRPGVMEVDVNESGTSLRFVLPLLPFFTSAARVIGRGTLVGRPNRHLLETLRRCGMDIRGEGAGESVPIDFRSGTLSGGRVAIDGSLSSQFVSALMIASPMAGRDVRLCLTGRRLVSRDYVVMTEQVLRRAGIRIQRVSDREYHLPASQVYRGLGTFAVPSDWGLAAFWLAAAALVPSQLELRGHFDDRLVQSDGAILGFARRMGIRPVRLKSSIKLDGPFRLKGGTFSLKDAPDLVPIMAVMGMFAGTPVRLTDIGHARVKESDRISDLRRELLKVGADIRETRDSLEIRPRPAYLSGVELDPHRDHRLAMAFAVLGLKIGVKVKDMDCCAKSYPGFVRHLRLVRLV